MKLRRDIALLASGVVLAGAIVSLRFVVSESRPFTPSEEAEKKEAPAAEQNVPAGPQSLSIAERLRVELEAIDLESESDRIREKLAKLAENISANDLVSALHFLAGQDQTEHIRELQQRLIRGWVERDANAAAEWVSQMAAGPAREAAMNDVAIVWANQDLPAAMDWARQLPDGAEKQSALLNVGYEAARTDPKQALQLASAVSEAATRQNLITHAASQWAADEPETAAEWANKISDDTARIPALAAVAAAWTDKDPAAAANVAVQLLPPGREQEDTLVSIIERWAQSDPNAVAGWVGQFPEGTLRQAAFDNLIKLWADQGLALPVNWLNALSAGASRDSAVAAYASKVAPVFPSVAALWAQSIGNDELRNRQMQAVGELWMHTDAAAARVWILQAPFSEETKARLLTSGGG